MLKNTPTLWVHRCRRGGKDSDHDEPELSVFTTWVCRFGSLAAAWPTAGAHWLGKGVFRSHYASLDSWLPGPTPWVEAFASAGPWDRLKFIETLAELPVLSLVQIWRVGGDVSFSLHPFIVDWLLLLTDKGSVSSTPRMQ
jgi:hypothetical protein